MSTQGCVRARERDSNVCVIWPKAVNPQTGWHTQMWELCWWGCTNHNTPSRRGSATPCVVTSVAQVPLSKACTLVNCTRACQPCAHRGRRRHPMVAQSSGNTHKTLIQNTAFKKAPTRTIDHSNMQRGYFSTMRLSTAAVLPPPCPSLTRLARPVAMTLAMQSMRKTMSTVCKVSALRALL